MTRLICAGVFLPKPTNTGAIIRCDLTEKWRLFLVPNALLSLNKCSVFRTWQGWLAMSNTGPKEGTLRLFPDVLVSNAYLLLRPFFNPVAPLESFADPADFLAASNWTFDNSAPDFPGIQPMGGAFGGQRLNADSHPHMRLSEAMVSVPRVNPGDMVFWHCGEWYFMLRQCENYSSRLTICSRCQMLYILSRQNMRVLATLQ